MSHLSTAHHFTFSSPEYLLALLVVPLLVAFAIVIRRRRARYAIAFTNLGMFARVHGRRRPPLRRWIGLALLALALAFTAAALARPHVHMTEAYHGATVILLVDISGSMDAADVVPSRLDAAVAAMHDFLNASPKDNKIGLVTFSDKVNVLNLPTTDRAAVGGSLDVLNPETQTALGDGVATAVTVAVTSLAQAGVHPEPGKFLPAAIVLESDGAQNRGKLTPQAAAELAKAAGIRIFGVALGTRYGQVAEGAGILRSIPVPPDPGTVRLFARVTGGQSYDATNASSLDQIYKHLGTTVGQHDVNRDITQWFLLAAAVLLVLGVAAERAWRSSLP
jgi:Ca-activated chloride channel family protein